MRPGQAARQRAVAAAQIEPALQLDVETVGEALRRVLEQHRSRSGSRRCRSATGCVAGSRVTWPASTAACGSSMTGSPLRLICQISAVMLDRWGDVPHQAQRDAGRLLGLEVRVAALDERRRDALAGRVDGRLRQAGEARAAGVVVDDRATEGSDRVRAVLGRRRRPERLRVRAAQREVVERASTWRRPSASASCRRRCSGRSARRRSARAASGPAAATSAYVA